jgi:serine/threonine protein kinase
LRLYGFFHDRDKIYLVVEYAPGGELYAILKEKATFPEATSARYIASLASALQYAHSKHVIHR